MQQRRGFVVNGEVKARGRRRSGGIVTTGRMSKESLEGRTEGHGCDAGSDSLTAEPECLERWKRNEALLVVEDGGLFFISLFSMPAVILRGNAANNRAALVPWCLSALLPLCLNDMAPTNIR